VVSDLGDPICNERIQMIRINCPLCNSQDTSLVESIPTSAIRGHYLWSFEIDTDLPVEEVSYFKCNDCKLGFFNPVTPGNSKLYENLQKYEWYYMSDKPEYSLAKKYLSSGGKILEVGAGKATFAEIINRKEYLGLEFNDDAIERARSKGITLLKETIEEHAVKNKKLYETVVSFQVLEHVSDPASFILACVDSLRDGGKLILAVPNHEGICGLVQNYLLDMPPHHLTHWSTYTLSVLAPRFGLELLAIEFEPVAEYHVAWVRKSLWELRIRRMLGMKTSLLDVTPLAKLVSRMALVLAKIVPLSVKNLKGHTVLAVYRKLN